MRGILNKDKSLTKTQLVALIAEKTGLTRGQVRDVFLALISIVSEELRARRSISIYGMLKILVKTRKATPERVGTHPVTKQEIIIKAKPAKDVVKVRALKPLKKMLELTSGKSK